MKIFAISGLGADQRVFEYLNLNHTIVPVTWITPCHKESITTYASRLVGQLGLSNESNFGIMGVSFGGLVAIEMSKIIKPKITIIISSVETRSELKSIYKIADKIKLINLVPRRFFIPPKFIAHYLFGTKNKALLNDILADTDLVFAKWATHELINWKNETIIPNLIMISGTNDKLLQSKNEKTIFIKDGAHFMIVDKANEISQIINKKLENFT